MERLSYEWATRDGLPDPSKRLRFRAEPDDEVFTDLFRRVLEGTLDAASQKEAAAVGAETQARQDVAFYEERMEGERSWWRVAETQNGELVGFGLPSKNTEFPVVGYLGVLPDHRGHGYGDDILAEITRILAADIGAEVIRADTDLENRPMAAAFERVGYRNIAAHLVLSAPKLHFKDQCEPTMIVLRNEEWMVNTIPSARRASLARSAYSAGLTRSRSVGEMA